MGESHFFAAGPIELWRLFADASKSWRKLNNEGTLPQAQYDACWYNFRQLNINALVKLRQQIAEMQKQAADLQKKNRPAVLAQLREQMAAYGITADELSRPVAKARKSKEPLAKPASPARGKKPAAPSPMKYRGPESQEWIGRAAVPKWLKDLVTEGKAREDFLIRQDAAA